MDSLLYAILGLPSAGSENKDTGKFEQRFDGMLCVTINGDPGYGSDMNVVFRLPKPYLRHAGLEGHQFLLAAKW
jgi:hypothetical protein